MALAKAPSFRARELVANSGRNLIAFICTMAAQFITLPLVVRWIGLEEFGVASVVLAIIAPLTVVGTALAQSTTREMATRLGRGDEHGADEVRETARFLCFLVCLSGAALIVGLGPVVLGIIGGSDYLKSAPWPVFGWAALGWAAQQAILLNQGECSAIQDFARMVRVTAISSTATAVSTLGISALWPSATGYMAGYSLASVLTWLCWMFPLGDIVTTRLRGLRMHRGARTALLHFGKWQSAAQLAGAASNQVDRYLLAAMVPASVVGQYSTAKRLEEAVYIGVVKLTEVLFPYFGTTSGESEAGRHRFFVCSSWLVATLSVAILGPMVPLADSVLRMWAGENAASGGAFLLRILILGGIVGCCSNVFTYCAMGMGMNVLVARLAWIYSLLTVAFSVLLLLWFGAMAAGMGLLAASAVRVVVASRWVRVHLFPDMSWSELIASTWLPLTAGVVASAGLTLVGGLDGVAWWAVMLLYPLIAVAIVAFSIALAVSTTSGRMILGSLLEGRRAA